MQDRARLLLFSAHSIGALELDCGGLIVPVNQTRIRRDRCILLIGERRETDNLHVRATGLAQLPDQALRRAQHLLGFPTRIRSILLFSYVHVCHNQKVRPERTATRQRTDRNAAANIFELHFKANASLHTLYQPGILVRCSTIFRNARPFPLLTITTRTHLLSEDKTASFDTQPNPAIL